MIRLGTPPDPADWDDPWPDVPWHGPYLTELQYGCGTCDVCGRSFGEGDLVWTKNRRGAQRVCDDCYMRVVG